MKSNSTRPLQLDTARSLRKGDLRVQYFDAAIALDKNDLSKARDMMQQVLKGARACAQPGIGRCR